MENKELTLDWEKYIDAARRVNAEGCILLENDDVLPLKKGTCVSVFGRIQTHYYKSGTGSGGMVNVTKTWGIVDGLKESKDITVNEDLEKIYLDWEEKNPFEIGHGWGAEPWSQVEMPLTEKIVKDARAKSDAAIVIIGRTAGEDKDAKAEAGSWFLTDAEKDMIKAVRSEFDKVLVLLNTGLIIDMGFVKEFNIPAVMYCWQGGMCGGLGIADVITGKKSPSGKLTDTIALIEDYPSAKNFGDPKKAVYAEDIYVGYRYFETFAKDKVIYPFGYGLSYTSFEVSGTAEGFEVCQVKDVPAARISVNVKNTGDFAGKEVIQIYAGCPQGKLGKPEIVLAAFKKTKELKAGEQETVEFEIPLFNLASFDDTGATGNQDCFVLEEGTYTFYAGTSSRDICQCGTVELAKTVVTQKVNHALYPVESFERMTPKAVDGGFSVEYSKVAAEAPYQNAHRDRDLSSIKDYLNTAKLDPKTRDMVKAMTDEDLSCIVRGEGMGSPKVTPGTAAAFGGISDNLNKLGLACACCTDGPSGIRLDSGAQAFSLPNGTMQASTFNPDLIEELYGYLGLEMLYNGIDVILGPGINIHRNPLNGRNFEYFSEDPFITGTFATAIVKGLHSAGVYGSLKHFAGNNQETGRWTVNDVVSARALREIYLKGFEMAVKNDAKVIMTTYGCVNGMWTAGSYDLNTLILRKDWGYTGIEFTDWWAMMNNEGDAEPKRTNIAQAVRAQNDLYMTVPAADQNAHGDNTLKSLEDGSLTRDEIHRVACNIVDFVRGTNSQKKMDGCGVSVKIINRQVTANDESAKDIVYYEIADGLSIDMTGVKAVRGSSWSFGLINKGTGLYRMEFMGKTGDNELAQVNATMSWNGVVIKTFCWGATHGEYVGQSLETIWPLGRYTVVNLFFAQGGIDFSEVKFTWIGDGKDKKWTDALDKE
ncbi:MAG: glycoside hydrolase family 3 C-terminal domain-containing protein [Treponema sp.]|nr:glycoside hydrolase family 3 C-terminal domain-containing protein [Treponema sp.]